MNFETILIVVYNNDEDVLDAYFSEDVLDEINIEGESISKLS